MVNNGMIMGWLGWLKAKKDHVPPNGWLKHVEKPQQNRKNMWDVYGCLPPISQDVAPIYPLVNVYIAIENGHL
jgi:hypothetical protein